ncbi:MAG: Flp pilus assembly protein CpaB [Acetobacteraceae bacterium]|nr:Flp pilus assembly protein CpaB [Acetobacteraceae bacterium]MBV8522964.1 Flp pilus assembly protein CpaB [Acetobacteraceae bacterium]MBV8588530.1 Flp pilus assembly protein CpaB [Acetobacteraceae bacterium]
MIIRLFLFGLMAIGLLGFGTVAWVSIHPATPSAATQVMPDMLAKRQVLLLARDVRAGSLLVAEDITSKELVQHDIPEGAVVDSPEARRSWIGGMVRRSLARGDVLLPADVMRPGDHGFLAAVLDKGMRAVTVGVDAVSGTAGLIWPGDRVDVILTQAIEDPSLPIGRRIAAEIVLRDARVIAIDQALVQGATPEASPPSGKNQADTARTVTLEVTEEQAARVQVAGRLGRLSLAVRAADQPTGSATAAGLAPTWAADVSHALNLKPTTAQGNLLRVYQGSDAGKEFHF